MIARRLLSRLLVSLCVVVGGLLCVWSAPALGQRLHEFGFSFGSEGGGDGQLMWPGALAVSEETGDVYVFDRGNERVEIFSSSGAYVGQFNGSASPTGAFSWSTAGTKFGERGPAAEGGVAIEDRVVVDNSTNPLDPSKGDVYVLDPGHEVLDKFTASGTYIGQIVDKKRPTGITVDPDGALWITNEFGSYVERFNDAAPVNEYVASRLLHIPNEGTSVLLVGYVGLAFDAEGNLYVGLMHAYYEFFTFPTEFSTAGEPLTERLDDEETSGLAVDESSGDVYVDHETSVAAYSPSHAAVERFGAGRMGASEGIAVDSKTGTVAIRYVTVDRLTRTYCCCRLLHQHLHPDVVADRHLVEQTSEL